MRRGAAVAEAARALVDTRFRLQGRGADGLDCVGLVAAALGIEAVPDDYALRCDEPLRVSAAMLGLGLTAARGDAPGDVALLRTGPAQLHLAVISAAGFVHADARLRRVVETPGRPEWPLLAAWR